MISPTRSLCLLALSALICTCDPAPTGGETSAPTEVHDHMAVATTSKPLSPHTAAMGSIGDVHVHVDYSSPGKRGRTIWGGLVAYDRVWATGAHNATSVNFSGPVRIAGQDVPAGTYALFTIPGREEWTVILNENYEQHLADDYDENRDVLRLTTRPEKLAEATESLTYAVKATTTGAGSISMRWDSLRVSIPVIAVQ
ncbi:hypothetical protein LEM8419_03462 [Neolewinella maritima]|uniref:DUF2911 domain-containing protein n=1 Tax=Neolewinella maritima TaxID=1383882 RepID=A0ABN8FED8_9BACT|nr:DUF2911 domain-containing protein [Neolewinella maritima]CAH1002588.1 hypothetical protein LEM8419_03462 [Neolewinella maritima]